MERRRFDEQSAERNWNLYEEYAAQHTVVANSANVCIQSLSPAPLANPESESARQFNPSPKKTSSFFLPSEAATNVPNGRWIPVVCMHSVGMGRHRTSRPRLARPGWPTVKS